MTARVSTALGTLLGCGLALTCGGADEGSGGARPSGGGTALTVGAERQGEATYYAATGEGAQKSYPTADQLENWAP